MVFRCSLNDSDLVVAATILRPEMRDSKNIPNHLADHACSLQTHGTATARMHEASFMSCPRPFYAPLQVKKHDLLGSISDEVTRSRFA
jgi:hypothetical protein